MLFKSIALLFAGAASASQPALDNLARTQPEDIVTYDQYSLKINGTRLFVFSGEFHPFRLPVPSLWLDIFQKIKAVGFNAVSWYADWALLEGKQGQFTAEGIFDFQPFFTAAKEAGIYLIARPGPYINAESSGGGFPGWLNRITGYLREANPLYLEAVQFYESQIGPIVASGQITNGGPVILVQPENEYSSPEDMLSHPYMADVENWYRNAGIVMPLISNDGYSYGNFAPGSGLGAVDIYGFDSYPLGFDCGQPTIWSGLANQYFPGLSPPTNTPAGSITEDPRWNVLHYLQSPSTPMHVSEFQGGSFDSWGGSGFDDCAAMTGAAFERVFYKNSYSFGLKGINYYMAYGGTNWGNLGFPDGYTSYDYGAAIKEDRTLMREKYSELKLQANFFRVAPGWLMTDAHDFTNHSQIANTDAITVTALTSNHTSFYVIRQSDFTSTDSTAYTLTVPTSAGNITIPQLGGTLFLNGRDSKIMTTDFSAGHANIVYSTAEILTWQQYSDKTVLMVYTGPDETNELALETTSTIQVIEGAIDKFKSDDGVLYLQWKSPSTRTVIQVGDVELYLLDRYAAYNYWILPVNSAPQAEEIAAGSVILNGGYLVRIAKLEGMTLSLIGDTNTTTTIEVVGSPTKFEDVTWNGEKLYCKQDRTTKCQIDYQMPGYQLPDLVNLDWKYADSLPEIKPGYSDVEWTLANHKTTNDTQSRNLTTPTSLYSTDYGYNTGALLYRTHFVANGQEKRLSIQTQGGSAYGASIWVNEMFIASWVGSPGNNSYYQNLTLPPLVTGKSYTITVLQDMMGLEESGPVGPGSLSKTPRGILNYYLEGHNASSLQWKLTGNLGGEDYQDHARGPLNEGGMYAERQGWHQPNPPVHLSAFSAGSPFTGLSKPGVGFYTASFALDMPSGWDIPLSFVFTNDTSQNPVPYRVQLFVNGYQFGKYINHIGPQMSFPVPEGILNYHGENWVAVTLWAMDQGGANIEGLALVATAEIQSGYGTIELSPMPSWQIRPGAY